MELVWFPGHLSAGAVYSSPGGLCGGRTGAGKDDQRRSTLTLAGAVTRLLLRAHAMKDVVSAGAVAALLLVPNLAFAQDAGAPGVTFARDIAPILQEKCQECHRKGTAAPMSLVTYEETRPWAKSIKER